MALASMDCATATMATGAKAAKCPMKTNANTGERSETFFIKHTELKTPTLVENFFYSSISLSEMKFDIVNDWQTTYPLRLFESTIPTLQRRLSNDERSHKSYEK